MLRIPQKLHTFDFRHMFHSNFIHLSMKKSNLCTFATALLLTLPSYSSAALNLLESKSGNTPLKVNARHTTGGKNVIDNSLKKSPKGTADNDDDFEIVTFHPKGEYKSLGTGTYCEGLFSFYGAPEQLRWNVEIEESVEVPGWYRLQPYKDSNPITDLIGKCDDTYIYVNATDPDFVIITPQVSGFEHKNPGSKANRYATPYYISHAGKQYLDEGYSKPDIIAYGHAATYDAKTGIRSEEHTSELQSPD